MQDSRPMGTRGQRCFEEANQIGGLVAKMRLASLAQCTSAEAMTSNDSAELLERLSLALARVREEFASEAPLGAAAVGSRMPVAAELTPRPNSPGEVARRCMTAVADLIAQRSLFVGDLEATVQRITEAASSTLDIERVSVWFLDEERTKVVCADLFERAKASHTAGAELLASDFSSYFAALAGERTIAAHDAHTDPRTSCFSQVYLAPLNIGAMLDVPIWTGGKMVGVICHEHIGGRRQWSNEEETFAYVLSSLVALTLERRTPLEGG